MAATLSNISLNDLYVNENGVVMPNTSEVKQLVEELFTDALGEACDFTAETPLGRLVEAITFLITGTVRINALCAGEIDPYHATGSFLDAVAAFHNVYRKSRIKTVVVAKLTGTGEPTIPAGSLASTESGDVFSLDADVTIDENGVGEGFFSSVEYGPVPCDVGTLTRINTAVPGWEGVTNESAGLLGSDTESDLSLRERVVAANDSGVGFINSIRSAVLAVDGVRSCVVYENGEDGTTVINGVVIPGHSVYICAEGGDDGEIAEAIYRTKSAGCGMASGQQGNSQEEITGINVVAEGGTPAIDVDPTEATYKDDGTGASYPITFYRPSAYKPIIRVSVQRWAYEGGNLVGDVRNAVANYVNGLPIGTSLTSFAVGMAIQSAIPTVRVASVYFHATGQSTEVALYGYQTGQVDADANPPQVKVTVA